LKIKIKTSLPMAIGPYHKTITSSQQLSASSFLPATSSYQPAAFSSQLSLHTSQISTAFFK
jgi:hypothetical protein